MLAYVSRELGSVLAGIVWQQAAVMVMGEEVEQI